MHLQNGAGGPDVDGIRPYQVVICLVLGILLVAACCFWWPSEEWATGQQNEQPVPTRVRPARSNNETESGNGAEVTAGDQWQPSPSEYWRPFVACQDYGTEPSSLVEVTPGIPAISQCNFAANLATKTPVVTAVFQTLLESGGAHNDIARIVRKCSDDILPMLDDWSYLGNRAEFDKSSTAPFVALALRCQVLVREYPKPDPRPSQAVLAYAEPVLTKMR